MTDTLDLTSLADAKVEDASAKHWAGGEHYLVTFSNGWGASVIRNRMSYGGDKGLYEIAILHGDDICYRSGLTDYVLGFLTPEQAMDTLAAIPALAVKKRCSHGKR